MTNSPKIVVIGAGVGGLTTATLLVQAGHDVTVLEANAYPGGCAGTFYHKGYRFDAGATVAGGFHDNGPHRILADQLGICWPARPTDPAWAVHLPGRSVVLGQDNIDMLTQFPHSASFWDEQQTIADLAWSLAAHGLPWPPTNKAELGQLIQTVLNHSPGVIRLLPFIFSTTRQWMGRHSLTSDVEFTRVIDAQLLISAQTTSRDANALYSATALDLTRQGVYQMEGGMGTITQTLVDKLTALGGRIHYRRQVNGIVTSNGLVQGVYVQTGKRSSERDFMPADFLIANLTRGTLAGLLDENSPPLIQGESSKQPNGWGAFVLHLGVESAKLQPNIGDHHQVVTDMKGPLGEGHSIFVSLSPEWDTSRAPAGFRAVTVSTHTDVGPWWRLLQSDPDAYESRKQAYTERILSAIDSYLPGFRSSVSLTLPGTPITYAYYTGRHRGLVGGIPQTSLLRARGPRTGIPNLRIVGDSIFPGQSTAGVTLGGMRVAKDVLRSLSHSISSRIEHTSPMEARS